MRRDDFSGDWQGLDDPIQAPRYALVAALLAGRRSVLDVGCGEAILARWLPGVDYLGLEPSREAIKGARGARVVLGRAEEFYMPRSFDAIVLNESLYYLEDPVNTVRRLTDMLHPDGLLLVSVYQKPATWRGRSLNVRAERALRRSLADWRIVADCYVGHHGGARWNVWGAQRVTR